MSKLSIADLILKQANPRFILSASMIFGSFSTFSQEKFAEYLTHDRLFTFQSFHDNSGHIAVVYGTSIPNPPPRKYTTHFLSLTQTGQVKVSMPSKFDPIGFGYTDSTFFFCDSGNGNLDIIEVHKERPAIVKTLRASYDGEGILTSFTTEQGAFYLITIVKKPGTITIRKFNRAMNPEISTVPVTPALYKTLTDERNFLFVHDRHQLHPDQVYSRDKAFLWSNKLYLVADRVKVPKKTGYYSGLRFIEIPLDQGPGEINERVVNVNFKGLINCFPLGDRLFLFECQKDRFSLSVASLSTLEIEKTFTKENEGQDILRGKFYSTAKNSFWKTLNDPTESFESSRTKEEFLSLDRQINRDPENTAKRLKKFDIGDPYVYARKVKEYIVISIGEYHFVSSGGGGFVAGPSSTISTPYGTGTIPGAMRSTSWSYTDASPTLSYVTSAMRADLTGPIGVLQETGTFEQIAEFAESDSINDLAKEYEIVPTPFVNFMVGYSNKADLFTIWLWKKDQ